MIFTKKIEIPGLYKQRKFEICNLSQKESKSDNTPNLLSRKVHLFIYLFTFIYIWIIYHYHHHQQHHHQHHHHHPATIMSMIKNDKQG